MRGVLVWGPAASWAAVLFLLSRSTNLPGLPWLPFADKVAHALLYAVLGVALGWARHLSGGQRSHAWFMAAGLLYGALDEWHQSFVPGRHPSLGDVAADAAGVLAGYAVSLWYFERRRNGRQPSPLSPTP